MTASLYPYSFTRRSTPRGNLADFMRQVIAEHPERLKPASWELPPERMDGSHVTFQNFHLVIPQGIGSMAVQIEEGGAHLCARLTAFAVRFLEKIAGHHVQKHGAVPTATELMADINAMADEQIGNPSHEVWQYSTALRHPVVHEAVTNALNDRWNRPDLDRGDYAPFFPSESEMIDAPVRRRPAAPSLGSAGVPLSPTRKRVSLAR